jgi:outer membrane protein assembly factor BamB
MNFNKGRYLQTAAFFLAAAFAFVPAGQMAAQIRVDPTRAPVSAAPMWDTGIGDTVRGTPHLQASSAVLVGENGSVRSFFMSGTHLWNFDARGRATQHVARSYEAATYVCSTEGLFMAINRVGRELWRLNLGKPISYPPVVGWDGRVFISLDSVMTCRTASGNSLWTIDLGSNIAFSPVLDKTGSVATVLQNMDFIKVGQFSHIERLRLNRLPSLIATLNEGSQQSYVLLYQSGEMEKITYNPGAKEGSRLTRTNLRSLPSTPVAIGSREARFLAILRDGRVLSIDANGSTIWTRNSHESPEEKGPGNLTPEQAKIMWDERGIYVITVRGVSAFTPEGRRRFVFKLSTESSGIPGFSDEGLLYATGKDNLLRVYKIDSKPRTVPQTKFYGPEPEGNYGMGSPPPSPWEGDNSRYDNTNQDKVYDEIRAIIRSGQIGKMEPVYVAYMMEMISFFIGRPQTSPVRPLVKPEERIRLIYLLAQVGSRETVPFLWHIFDLDREPSVRRACADAIGTIGVDPTGRSMVSYNFLLTPNNPNTDPQLVLAATSSIAALCRFSGPPLSAEGIRILRLFSNLPTIPNNIRVQIRNELDGLFKEGLDSVLQ